MECGARTDALERVTVKTANGVTVASECTSRASLARDSIVSTTAHMTRRANTRGGSVVHTWFEERPDSAGIAADMTAGKTQRRPCCCGSRRRSGLRGWGHGRSLAARRSDKLSRIDGGLC
jgi:hypothetical protein